MSTTDVQKSLRLLAGELRVSLEGLDADDQDIVALRFIMDGQVTADVLQRIVDDVRGGGGQATVGSTSTEEPAPSPAPTRGLHFNATEADRKSRLKMADRHRAETRRTGLYLVPRRPKLPADVPHQKCAAAAREDRDQNVCERCRWLLGAPVEYIESWIDRDDDARGRG